MCSFELLPKKLNSEWSIIPDKNLQILVKTGSPEKLAQMHGKYVQFKTAFSFIYIFRWVPS